MQIDEIRNCTLLILFCTLCSVMNGCDKNLHEENILPNDGSKSGVTIFLNTSGIQGKPLNDVHIYFFNEADILTSHYYYAKMTDLALDRILMKNGHYTVFAILNTEENLTLNARSELSDVLFADFILWVKTLNVQYDHLLTGAERHEVKKGVSLVTIDIKEGSEAAEMTKVIFNLTYPQPRLPDYIATKTSNTDDNIQLRAIIELFHKGTGNKISRHAKFVEPTSAEGVYSTTIAMPKGEFDMCIWGDYTINETEDYHYNTTNLKDVKILSKESYWANIDTRDGFVYASTIMVKESSQTESYILHRPVAKYEIVTTDLEKYNEERIQTGYPPAEMLNIIVDYAGFLPAGYNVANGTLTASCEGYKYTAEVTNIDEQKATIAKDFVLVNGNESGVVVNIIVKDNQGSTINIVNGVKINYKSGHLTTINGEFLTTGKGGVNIITDWDGEYNVEF